MRPRQFSDGTLRQLYQRGLNDVEIAKKVGVSTPAVWKRRQKLGLTVRKRKGPRVKASINIAFSGPWITEGENDDR